jgi:diguanylate cyclase (GGDEF)-like protein
MSMPQNSKNMENIWTITSFLLLLGIGIIDYLTGPEYSFSVFYLIPVTLTAWFSRKHVSIVFSIFVVLIWLSVDYYTGRFFFSIAYLWNFVSRLTFLLAVVLLLTLLKQALRRERELSRIDYLTQCLNSRAFYEFIELEMNRSARYEHLLTIVYIDIDNFKFINDTTGHLMGDKLLRTIVDVIKKNLRQSDLIARMGGDEFAILLPETNQEAARTTITKIRNRLANSARENNWPVTFSIGVVTCIQMPPTVDKLIELGDQLMYTVKNNGKDGVNYKEYVG